MRSAADSNRARTSRAVVGITDVNRLRLLARVARLYHERGLRQPEIATLLHFSQARVSRLLKEAEEQGIVRTVIELPPGVHSDLEDEIRERYGLRDVVVVEAGESEDGVLTALGGALAAYLEVSLFGGDRIGISSWSESLLAAVDVMRPSRTPVAESIVQVVGGIGSPAVQVQATRLVSRLAAVTGAEPVLVSAPGLVSTAAIREVVESDEQIAAVRRRWTELTLLLVGIGSVEPSPLLARSGNAMALDDAAALRKLGAVGDICLRFFDRHGRHLSSPVDERVIGIGVDEIRAVDRRVAVAGGLRKLAAVRAALEGEWINVLITDLQLARGLV